MRRRSLIRRGAAVLAVLAAAAPAALPASANPIDDKRAQAAQLAQRLDELGNQESALAERYNQAVLAQNDVQRRTADAQARLDQAKAQAAAVTTQVRGAAVDAYMNGTQNYRGGAAQASSAYASVYIETVTGSAADTLDALAAAQSQVADEQRQLDVARQKANQAVKAIDDRRQAVMKTEADLAATQAKVKGELADLVAQAEAAQQAADAARAQALARASEQQRATRSRPAAPAAAQPSASPPAPAPNKNAQAAVNEALRQVGKPYKWGAAGPDSFDCSGLTMWAWRAGGVSLPHYTGAQYSSTTHISMSELQPGDLVYSGDMGHMAMYIGNGNIVEAPRTGLNVRVVPMRPEFTLASRP